jgi:putative ABC transport system permease protein
MTLYFKQAWQILKQNPFYSIVYIAGTGLSISMVMVLAIVFYIKIADISPETTRSRLLITQDAKVVVDGENSRGSYHLSLEVVKKCFYSLQSAEAVAVVYTDYENGFVQPDGSEEQIPASIKCVDDGYWKVFSFSFMEGNPFTEADLQSGIRTVVIAESFARRIFGTTEVTGKQIRIDFEPYRICGVVKDVSYATDKVFAQLWLPYTAIEYQASWDDNPYQGALGAFITYVLAPSSGEVNNVKAEILENLHKYNASSEGVTFSVMEQPEDRQWQAIIRHGDAKPDFTKQLILYGLIFFILLLVPAVSLSGMADSQMEKRLSEIGVRRSFGAPWHTLMYQLVIENLLFNHKWYHMVFDGDDRDTGNLVSGTFSRPDKTDRNITG